MNKKLISAILCGTIELLGAASPAFAEAEGATVDVVYPETATADAQIKVLDNLISQEPDAICIAA